MIRRNISYLCLFIITLLFYSCKNTQVATNTVQPKAYNFSAIYNPGESTLNPEFRTYMQNNNSAVFYYKININELRRLQESIEENYANLTIRYVLRDSQTQEVADSSSLNLRLPIEPDNEHLENSFDIRIPSNRKYRLIVSFSGETAKKSKRILEFIDNTSDFSQNQFLLVTGDSAGNTLMKNFVEPGKSYRIISSNNGNIPVTIEYHKFPVYTVRPPYSTFTPLPEPIVADSVFTYRLGDTLNFPEKGYYFLKNTSQPRQGITFLCVNSSFPEVSTVGDMLEPVKLIATSKEYKKITDSENIKQAIDEFWLSKSNNQKFAKEQVRVFYSRVKLANLYFSDNNEGWKTDRGNIYIMFGPPSIINLTDDKEEWFYGGNTEVASLMFVFDKKDNPYSTNSYELVRDNLYQPTWAQALSTWRKGRVFVI